MNKTIALVLGAMLLGTPKIDATTMIGKNSITLKSDLIHLQIGRAVQQECRDRSRMPSSA